MPDKPYYAHIAQDQRVQTVMEHLSGAAEHAGECLANVGLGQAARLAGLLHDLGKCTQAFQQYLREGDRSKRGSVIHTFQGCRYLLDGIPSDRDAAVKAFTSELLAFAIGAHHGLFDCVDAAGNSGLRYRKEKAGTFYAESVEGFFTQGITPAAINEAFDLALDEVEAWLDDIDSCYEQSDEYCFEVGLLARLLLSAVIDGDRFDTAAFMGQPALPVYADIRAVWQDRLAFMERKLAAFPVDTVVNKARCAISARCRAFAERPGGVYRLNVPTGGGKTLGSLRYALAHAAKYGHKHLIFTSPLLSILEQNAAVLREYIGDDRLILEHHSNVVQTEQTQEQLDERELLVQSWNAPIILTTLVQLLNTMFDGRTGSIRRFQALCNSVIVIDEVQTVPTRLLSLFNLTVRFLAQQCGATVILCSATQPYLEGAAHPLLPPPESIIPNDPSIWAAFARTRLCPLDNLRLEQIPSLIRSLMKDAESLLVVCNKKDEAAYLLEQTRSADCVSYHLSASMCMQHRRDTVRALYSSLRNKEKVLCISTQVIEAGVDISFQRVLRLTAGMDSIIQSAGRCNRNGESDAPCPVYIVNCTDEKLENLQDIRRGKTATIALLHAFRTSPERFENNLASDAAIEYYYRAFYADMGPGTQDYPLPKLRTTLLDLLGENRAFAADSPEAEFYALRQAFKTAGQSFSVFEEDTADVLVPYKEGAALISEMSSGLIAADASAREHWLKKAAGYTVSLYAYQRKRLEEKGALLRICGGAVLALLPEFYDGKTGLQTNGTEMDFWEV